MITVLTIFLMNQCCFILVPFLSQTHSQSQMIIMLKIIKQLIIQSMGSIVESSIKSTTTSFWEKFPTLPTSSLLNFDLSNYNKSFVNFTIVAGLFTIAHSAVCIGKKTIQKLTTVKTVPTRKQLLDKYGHYAWALIGDCKGNQQYCNFLALNGFSLILMGQQDDIKITRDQIANLNVDIRIEVIPVNWQEEESNIKFYQELYSKLETYDIAFLVLPKLIKNKQAEVTHLEILQPFQHVYLLVRFFGQKLRWRSYKSALIFPSYLDVDQQATVSNGTTKSLIAGSDAFGRTIGFELKNTVEVVVARGSVENAFIGLGKDRITL